MLNGREMFLSLLNQHVRLTIAGLLTTTATPSTPAVSNVLINPSLIGTKNILITTNMVSQNSSSEPLKRKHEEDDDYDALWWKKQVLPV